ncbi:MAG: 50S ribosomal protein L11 methyltransferase [Chitinophagales bacterium]|nr:50S ribosomal protein L11 methyltransferase [Chitinophagales bacterium]
MRYLSFVFTESDVAKQEIIIASLDAIGFEGFEQKSEEVICFVPDNIFLEKDFNEAISELRVLFTVSFSNIVVKDENWNEQWEKNFQPIIIGKELLVRASFHPQNIFVKQEIIIDPKMSFGTGHHATTSMMLQLMLKNSFVGKEVLDFGCGTAILSILAAKKGCKNILAIDNETNAIENADENFKLNGIANYKLIVDDKFNAAQKFDIILANITREAIRLNLPHFNHALNKNGLLFISGFLIADEHLLVECASNQSLKLIEKKTEGDWLALLFTK